MNEIAVEGFLWRRWVRYQDLDIYYRSKAKQ